MHPTHSRGHVILITGAAGFVGTWMLAKLRPMLDRGVRVVLASAPDVTSHEQLQSVALDVSDRAAVDEVIRTVRPTCVVHLAAVSSVAEALRAPATTWEVNVGGTRNIAEAILAYTPDARLLFASSADVYGGSFNEESLPLEETAPLDPMNPYGSSKAAAEMVLCELARRGLSSIRFRAFNHTGPGQTGRFVIPAFASQIAAIEAGKQEPVIRVGNLDAERDFLDVRDVVEAYTAAAFSSRAVASNAVINLASGRPRQIGVILQELLSRAAVYIRVEPDPARLRPSDTPRMAGARARAEQVLGWTPRVDWDTTLDDVLSYWRGETAAGGLAVPGMSVDR